MLDSLRFVQGAVAKKDFVPALTHFSIRGGVITGYNGALALCSPIALDLDCCPRAMPFIKAIQTCRETIQLHLTDKKRLSIKSGSFKALIECTEEEYPEVEPEGEMVEFGKGVLIQTLELLEPFVSEDASRPWSRGILFKGDSAFATNNVVLVERWLGGARFPGALNIPASAIKELLRIGEDPVAIQVGERSATFHFDGGRWLLTQSYPTDWPDLARVLQVESSPLPFPDGLWQAIEDIRPFVDATGRFYMRPGAIDTSHESAGAAAAVDVPGVTHDACFHIDHFRLLQNTATRIDLTSWPKPCQFFGDKLRGAIVGIRTQ
jgi:DNA polymerase III sliding clamp (beta) subunit (PCNA family)